MPRLTTHEATQQIQATSFVVLARVPFSVLISQVKYRELDSVLCVPLLRAAEYIFINDIRVGAQLSKDITRYVQPGWLLCMLDL